MANRLPWLGGQRRGGKAPIDRRHAYEHEQQARDAASAQNQITVLHQAAKAAEAAATAAKKPGAAGSVGTSGSDGVSGSGTGGSTPGPAGPSGAPGPAGPPGAGVPPGTIVMWVGGAIPAGWVICDGSNGTPDLSNRFPMGAAATGATGGNPTHSHGLIGNTDPSPDLAGCTVKLDPAGTTVNTSNHTHPLTHATTDLQSNLPPFIALIFIMKT